MKAIQLLILSILLFQALSVNNLRSKNQPSQELVAVSTESQVVNWMNCINVDPLVNDDWCQTYCTAHSALCTSDVCSCQDMTSVITNFESSIKTAQQLGVKCKASSSLMLDDLCNLVCQPTQSDPNASYCSAYKCQCNFTNFALGKPTQQSSTYSNSYNPISSKAVDGNTNGQWTAGSTTHTNNETNPWWYVDLGSKTTVRRVIISNRQDCCTDRLNNFNIYVGDSTVVSQNTPCYSSVQPTFLNTKTFYCPALQGRYVGIQITGINFLSLAEVEVYSV